MDKGVWCEANGDVMSDGASIRNVLPIRFIRAMIGRWFTQLVIIVPWGIQRLRNWINQPVREDQVFIPIGIRHPPRSEMPMQPPLLIDGINGGNGSFGGGVAGYNPHAPCWICAQPRAHCECPKHL